MTSAIKDIHVQVESRQRNSQQLPKWKWGGSTYSDMVSLFQFVKQLHHGHRHIEICCYFKILKDKIYKKKSEQN